MVNTGCREPGARYRVPGNGCRMPDAGCQMPDAGYQMPDTRCRMPDAGYQMPDAGCRKAWWILHACRTPSEGLKCIVSRGLHNEPSMNHTYFLVTFNEGRSGQSLWEFQANQLWETFEPDHSLLDDPNRLILSDEELDKLLRVDCFGFRFEEFDSTVTNTLWWKYGDDDGGPARLTRRFCLDKNRSGEWEIVETGP